MDKYLRRPKRVTPTEVMTSAFRYSDMTNAQIVLEVVRASIRKRLIQEAVTSFYVFRTDTNQVLAKGVLGYDNAKDTANQLRKKLNLKWDQVSFKSERGKSRRSAAGYRIDYSPRYNPSKRTRFKGVFHPDGSYHDLD